MSVSRRNSRGGPYLIATVRVYPTLSWVGPNRHRGYLIPSWVAVAMIVIVGNPPGRPHSMGAARQRGQLTARLRRDSSLPWRGALALPRRGALAPPRRGALAWLATS